MYLERWARRDYKAQKKTATARGIPFKFTFEEWVAWWEQNLGTDWQLKRGKKLGQYVMARKGDVGPYTVDNVRCITASQNSSESNRGTRSRKTKLTEAEVLDIFMSPESSYKAAMRYGIRPGNISAIRQQLHWKHLTAGLKPPKRTIGVGGAYHWGSKLTNKEVISIFLARGTHAEISRMFQISYRKVWEIRTGRRWYCLTSKLRTTSSRHRERIRP